jgi:hypothetical protein
MPQGITWTRSSRSAQEQLSEDWLVAPWAGDLEFNYVHERSVWARNSDGSIGGGGDGNADRLLSRNHVRRYFYVYADPANPDTWFLSCRAEVLLFSNTSSGAWLDVTGYEIDPLTFAGIETDVSSWGFVYQRWASSFRRHYVITDGTITPISDLVGIAQPPTGGGATTVSFLGSPTEGATYTPDDQTGTFTQTGTHWTQQEESWPARLEMNYIHIPRDRNGRSCVSFTFPNSSVTYNHLDDGDLETLVGPRANYRPMNVI